MTRDDVTRDMTRDAETTDHEPHDRSNAEWSDPLTVLVDDTRDFKDGRPALTARTSGQALALLEELAGTRIDALWLDYDLGDGDTAQPVVDHLVALAAAGRPQHVTAIHVHSSNIRHGHRICAELVAAAYPARRSYAANLWVRVRWQGWPPR